MKFDLWTYINPSTPKDQLPTLLQPQKPTPDDVKSTAGAQTPGASSNTQDNGASIGSFTDTVKQPISGRPDAITHPIRLTELTPGEISVFKALMLSNLMRQFAPSDRAWKLDITFDWAKAHLTTTSRRSSIVDSARRLTSPVSSAAPGHLNLRLIRRSYSKALGRLTSHV